MQGPALNSKIMLKFVPYIVPLVSDYIKLLELGPGPGLNFVWARFFEGIPDFPDPDFSRTPDPGSG